MRFLYDYLYLYFSYFVFTELKTLPEVVDDYKEQVSTVLSTLNNEIVGNLKKAVDNSVYIWFYHDKMLLSDDRRMFRVLGSSYKYNRNNTPALKYR